MGFRTRWAACLALCVLVVAGLGVANVAQASSPAAAYEPDANSNGTLTFYDANGTVVTSGGANDAPFATYIQASASGHSSADTRATLFGFLPKLGQATGAFIGEQLSLATTYPIAAPGTPANISSSTLPMAKMGAPNKTLAGLAADFPNIDPSTTDGYGGGLYQMRVKTSSTANGVATTYEDASVVLTGCTFTASGATCPSNATWTQVYPAVVGGQSTTTTLTLSPPSPQGPGTTVHLTATVTPSGAGGSVQFLDGATPIGATVTVSGGMAVTSTVLSALGTHPLTAQFTPSNSALYNPSTSSPASYVIAVSPPVTISTTSLPAGNVGAAYAASLVASGGTAPYTWSLAGSLPAGLSLNVFTGAISGTPTVTGTANITATVTDATNPTPQTASKTLVIVINAAPPLTISTTSLPAGNVGAAYAASLVASGGTPPYAWSLTGNLPAGLSLNQSTGAISGTPSTSGTANLTATVTDAAAQSASKALSIAISTTSTPPLTITTASLPDGAAGVAYSATLSASGGTSPYFWTLSTGALPPGLSLSTSGVISGTPTTAANDASQFIVRVTDATLPAVQVATANLSILVTLAPKPVSIATGSLPDGGLDAAYSATLTAVGGVQPFHWSLSAGTLPSGLSLESSTGAISGTPSSAGRASFTVAVTDSSSSPQTATKDLSITINPIVTGGYRLVAADGGLFSFGFSKFFGSTGSIHLNQAIVGMAPTPDGAGYWLVAADGGIFSFGDAGFYGSTGGMSLNKPIVGMATTPDGLGYWLVAADGGIFRFGDAGFLGSAGSIHLNQRIVGMATTPDGLGYWLVAADGGIFRFGDAGFFGSAGSIHLHQPMVGMAATRSGGGYWLVASDGGIFAYGDAASHGSAGSMNLNKPVVGMAATLSGGGYWLVASDGGIFAFGDAGSFGSAAAIHLTKPIVGMGLG